MTLSPTGADDMTSAPDAHVLSRPRGRCRQLRRRFRAQVALGLLSAFAVAALGARALLAAEPMFGF